MDRTRLPEADAIVFHHFSSHWPKGDLPTYRSTSQLYVAWIGEPATYTWTTQRLGQFPKDFFNISMTYRLDSHIPIPCVTTKPRQTKQPDMEAIMNRTKSHPKKKLVAWFVSHCKTKSDRESYVKELQKYIEVDIYVPLKCGTKKSPQCYKMLEGDYRFYLSFENSICKDYVTEKLGKDSSV